MPLSCTIHSHRIASCVLLIVLATTTVGVFGRPANLVADDENVAPSSANAAAAENASDLSRKAGILNSPAWQRAVFELGHWLDSQQIYTAPQVASIKRDFNARVAKMSSFELQYLLTDLEAKFQVMDTPEARDARAWIGHYLSAASDSKRAELLKDVPDLTRMSAGELSNEIEKIAIMQQQLVKRQTAFDQSRHDAAASQQQSIAATQRAVASANRSSGSSYSPYRGSPAGGKTPFSDVKTGGSVHVMAGPFGAYVSF